MLPLFAKGIVVHGFGRGSKQLGIPTANLPDCVVANLPEDVRCGVFYGFASVRSSEQKLNGISDSTDHAKLSDLADITVYPAVASIGWNPFYKNNKRTLEVHILQVFPEDFYGAELRVCLAGWIRDQQNFNSKDELIAAIDNDIRHAKEKLQEPIFERLRSHDFFVQSNVPRYPFYDDGNSRIPQYAFDSDTKRVSSEHCPAPSSS